jgi:galactosylceramidase
LCVIYKLTNMILKNVLFLLVHCCLIMSFFVSVVNGQTINIDGVAGGKRFDGIGAVSGGGATSVLLKDYPEPQRSQVLDLHFGASISALLVEVPGDGNSTQGSESSHMHSRNDLNFSRGYEWWIMSEARKRNPAIMLDANAWSVPKWVGDNNWWSQDMCDYYVSWIKGLKSVYGLDLNAIGCHNEKGVNEDFVKMFRTTLNKNGLSKVKIHAFDNWDKDKWDWVKNMETDSVLRASVDIIGAHVMVMLDSLIPTPPEVKKLSEELGKPIWNTEEHVYLKGYDCELSMVESFNKNFIESGATMVVNWFLVASFYGIEPYPEDPAIMVAREPWSGNYYTREVLWAYAHYGQFTKAGWQYLNGACGKFPEGGTYVTLKSPEKDFSIIAETKDAKANQKVSFKVSGGLSSGKLCVWRSNSSEQFVKLDDIIPVNGSFELVLEPQSIYSVSTTNGQQKGSFASIPTSKPFPFPYFETFESYKDAKVWGYLPHYTADIDGVFEIADRPDKKGKCLRQVVEAGSQGWAPEWTPYTILGDQNWKDYEISADVSVNNDGWAGIMGRVIATGTGFGCKPSGYYIKLSADGTCMLYVSKQDENDDEKNQEPGTLLATGKATKIAANQWHTLMLRFSGSTITGFVDKIQVLIATDTTFPEGMVGLVTGSVSKKSNTALFDNLMIKPVNSASVAPVVFSSKIYPMYQLPYK